MKRLVTGFTIGLVGLVNGISPFNPAAHAAAFKAIKQAAMKTALSQQQGAAGFSYLDVELTRIVNLRLAQHFFAGACIRDYSSPCPMGWDGGEGAEADKKKTTVQCIAPYEYTGPCKGESLEVAVNSAPERKAEISLNCLVEWPCKVCKKRYDTCPQEWTAVQSRCTASRQYDGVCEKTVDFTGMTDMHKARWAARCRAVWPCDSRPQPPDAQTGPPLTAPTEEKTS